jgi:protein-disulfide isomerase
LKLQLPVLAVGAALALMSVAPGAAGRSALTSSRVAVQTTPPSLQAAVAAVRSELKGIPQQGMVLGSSSAPVTVFEYADLICPTCATAAGTVVASVIKHFVRSGEVNIEFEPIVESPRSEQLALGAFAAGEWSLGWDYAQLAYIRSTPQSNGPLDAPQTLAGSLGLNGRDWLSAYRRRLWPALIEQSAKVALVGGFSAYPVFIVRSSANGFGSRPFVRVLRAPVTLAQLSATIRRALRAAG